MATGFGFGAPASSAPTGGFSFGTPTATTAATGLNPAAAPAAGFSLGGATPAKTQGFSLGLSATPQTSTPALGSGFSLTTPATATTTTSAPAAGGFSFGFGGTQATTTAASTGFSLGTTTAASTGLGGFSLNKPATSTSILGGLGTSTPASTGVGLFGATPSATTTSAGSIFSTATTSAATLGLGGVDPKTSTATGSSAGASGKSSDGKAVKETQMPGPLVETVTAFQKYVKDEKTVREDIARMSTKPMLKVQEDTAALKQLLSVVSNGLQRNACAVDKLKKEMAHELKNAEMAQRTKDIPPGLQYENTAPSIYFNQLVDEFEGRMITYRQQIETLENHLAALHQPTRHSPAELIALMKKLHETFIALAAQLHQVNEAVKIQKEHFLNYRKIFHGDTKNIFEKQQKAPVLVAPSRTVDPAGPTPFPGMTNAAAAAMASVLNKSQQPAGAPPVIGLSTGTLGGAASGLGTLGSMGAGGLFGGGQGLGSSSALGTSSIFNTPTAPIGSTTATQGFSFASSTPQTAGVPGMGVPGGLGAIPNQSTLSAGTNKPFQLQKPPQAAKRGKR